MKNRFLRFMMSSAFAMGLAAPLVASYTPPAEAFQACSLTSGSDSWTGFNADGSSYTVSVAYDTGVSITGTPPPLASLPVSHTSLTGHRIAISADPAGGGRVYEGDFASTMPVNCRCQGMSCGSYSHACDTSSPGMSCHATEGGCTSSTCGSGGYISTFTAAF
jgi:hypothetical protein